MKQDNPFGKIAEDATKGGKEQIDSFMKAGNIIMKGVEDITKACMSWTQDSAEKNSQALKALMSCKTVNEYAEAQNKWAQQSFDDFMAGATKLSELSVKIASDAFEPINDQLGKCVRKATDSMAA